MSSRHQTSLTVRLTLLFAAASTAVLLALGFLIGRAVEQHFEEMDTAQLTSELQHAQSKLKQFNSSDNLKDLQKKLDEPFIGKQGLVLAVFDSSGKQLFASVKTDFPSTLFSSPQKDAPVQWEHGEQTFRAISERSKSGIAQWPELLIIVAKDTSEHKHFMGLFQATLWWFVALAAFLMGMLGWFAARRGLAPLKKMTANMSDVSASRLTRHLEPQHFPAELAELAYSFNEMLSRLEESFARLTNFSSDIAHELRTPVSNLMTQTQVALSKARTIDEYQEILASNSEELERMSAMVADMLFLAKADHDLELLNIEPISLVHELQDIAEFYDALAEEKQMRIVISGDAEVSGNRLMLRRAFSNLISNAIRHTRSGGEVSIAISLSNEQKARVEVCNPGNIPEEHLPHLFDRFYRVDPSRHRNGEGTGLGLAITKSIIESHSGTIEAKSDDGLVCFVLLFK